MKWQIEAVGLDYYDRFEWLLRTDMRCSTDNLIVERAEAARTITFESIDSLPSDLQPTDLVTIQGFRSIAKTTSSERFSFGS